MIDMFILIEEQNINFKNLQRFKICINISICLCNKIIQQMFVDLIQYFDIAYSYVSMLVKETIIFV